MAEAWETSRILKRLDEEYWRERAEEKNARLERERWAKALLTFPPSWLVVA